MISDSYRTSMYRSARATIPRDLIGGVQRSALSSDAEEPAVPGASAGLMHPGNCVAQEQPEEQLSLLRSISKRLAERFVFCAAVDANKWCMSVLSGPVKHVSVTDVSFTLAL